MRHNVKRERPWPPDGSMTIFREQFLWLPVKAENKATGQLERRWLEKATYLTEVSYWVNAFTKWTCEPVEWIDSAEQEMSARRAHRRDLERYMEWVRQAETRP